MSALNISKIYLPSLILCKFISVSLAGPPFYAVCSWKYRHWVVRPSDTIPGCWISKINLIFSLNRIEYRTIHSNSGEEFRKSDIFYMFLDVFRKKLDIFQTKFRCCEINLDVLRRNSDVFRQNLDEIQIKFRCFLTEFRQNLDRI